MNRFYKLPVILIQILLLYLLSDNSLKAQAPDPVFRQLLNLALQKSDTIQLNQLRMQQVLLDEQTARLTYLPRLSTNVTYTRLNADLVFPQNTQTLLLGAQRLLIKEAAGIPFNTALPASVKLQPVPPIQEKNILKMSATSQWVLFSGFKVENALKACRHQHNALRYTDSKAAASLISSLAAVYDRLALLRAADSVLAASELVLAEQSRFVNTAIKNGLATPLDRRKLELAVQKLALKKAENNSNRIVLLEKLQQLTGAGYDQLQQLQPALEPLLLVNDSLQQERPEISSLNEAILAATYKEKAEKSEYIPKLVAFGQYEFRDKDLSLLDPRWYAGLRLQWNLFDGFTARNNARKASLDKKAFTVQKQAVNDLLLLALAKAREEYRMANQRIQMVLAQERLATETLDLVQKQYRNGLSTITDWLTALSDLEKTRFDLQQAYFDQRRSAIQLLDANGTLTNEF